MINATQVTIKDCTYTIVPIDAMSAAAGLGVLLKHMGGALGMLLSGGFRSLGDLPPGALSGVLTDLGTALSAPDFMGLMIKLLEGTKVQAVGGPLLPLVVGGNTELLRGHFTGDVWSMIALFWHATKGAYDGFGSAFAGLLPGRTQ